MCSITRVANMIFEGLLTGFVFAIGWVAGLLAVGILIA